jgi:LysM repeat protein
MKIKAKFRLRHAAGAVIFALAFGLLGAAMQDLGEVARQERARRAREAACAPRVLSNEDLSRRQILQPEDRVPCEEAQEARVKTPAPTAVPAAPEVAVEPRAGEPGQSNFAELPAPPPPGAPLGDVARYYRALRQARQTTTVPAAPDVAITLRRATPAVNPPGEMPVPAAPVAAPSDTVRYFGVLRELYGTPPVAPDVPMTIWGAEAAPPAFTALPPAAPPQADVAEVLGTRRDEGHEGQPGIAPEVPMTVRPGRVELVPFAAVPPPPEGGAPLGDVARYYRAVRESRERQEAVNERAAELQAGTAIAVELGKVQRLVVQPAGVEQISVARGDSLWKLAEQHLGSGLRWRELAALNPEVSNPDLIYVGQVIRLRREEVFAVARERRVERGDTLWKLAEAAYGSGLAWTCIAAANPQVENADLIFPNQVLALPESCGESL